MTYPDAHVIGYDEEGREVWEIVPCTDCGSLHCDAYCGMSDDEIAALEAHEDMLEARAEKYLSNRY